ncbi:hypothetical protein D3C76_1573770 [compost metagenome]
MVEATSTLKTGWYDSLSLSLVYAVITHTKKGMPPCLILSRPLPTGPVPQFKTRRVQHDRP